jgi:hypothetical protein
MQKTFASPLLSGAAVKMLLATLILLLLAVASVDAQSTTTSP